VSRSTQRLRVALAMVFQSTTRAAASKTLGHRTGSTAGTLIRHRRSARVRVSPHPSLLRFETALDPFVLLYSLLKRGLRCLANASFSPVAVLTVESVDVAEALRFKVSLFVFDLKGVILPAQSSASLDGIVPGFAWMLPGYPLRQGKLATKAIMFSTWQAKLD